MRTLAPNSNGQVVPGFLWYDLTAIRLSDFKVDDSLIRAQQQAYSVAGVDENVTQ